MLTPNFTIHSARNAARPMSARITYSKILNQIKPCFYVFVYQFRVVWATEAHANFRADRLKRFL